MKKYYCDVCNEWVDDMPLDGCYYYKNAICDATEKQCDAIRYVRADVALRYARMRERKAYVQGFTDEAQQSINVFLQQSSQREYRIEKCHTCNRIKTACVCGLREWR